MANVWITAAVTLSWLSAAGALFATTCAFLRRWTVASVVAGSSVLLSLGAFVVMATFLFGGFGAVWLPAAAVADPADKAAHLAESISRLMNAGALAALAAPMATLLWTIARARSRALAAEGER